MSIECCQEWPTVCVECVIYVERCHSLTHSVSLVAGKVRYTRDIFDANTVSSVCEDFAYQRFTNCKCMHGDRRSSSRNDRFDADTQTGVNQSTVANYNTRYDRHCWVSVHSIGYRKQQDLYYCRDVVDAAHITTCCTRCRHVTRFSCLLHLCTC